mmetsp:Transcript_9065/g.13731  ORF Transcript_9065/g.13731 Transcript_9065/m.13731 type:complete len:255 (-) Transcript_9065:702-1466(-)
MLGALELDHALIVSPKEVKLADGGFHRVSERFFESFCKMQELRVETGCPLALTFFFGVFILPSGISSTGSDSLRLINDIEVELDFQCLLLADHDVSLEVKMEHNALIVVCWLEDGSRNIREEYNQWFSILLDKPQPVNMDLHSPYGPLSRRHRSPRGSHTGIRVAPDVPEHSLAIQSPNKLETGLLLDIRFGLSGVLSSRDRCLGRFDMANEVLHVLQNDLGAVPRDVGVLGERDSHRKIFEKGRLWVPQKNRV